MLGAPGDSPMSGRSPQGGRGLKPGQGACGDGEGASLSARRAWIETGLLGSGDDVGRVALRKEGVD